MFLGALFCGPYLCICVFGCYLLWSPFVHLHFWVLSFVATICAFALLGALFCGHYLCVHLCFWVLSFMVTICAFVLLCALFCGHYLFVHLRFWVLSLDGSSLVIPSLFPLLFHVGCFYKVLLGFHKLHKFFLSFSLL